MADITLPDRLTDRIESRVQHTEFGSVDEYAEFVLSEIVTQVERESTDGDAAVRDDVENRLQSLGYLEE